MDDTWASCMAAQHQRSGTDYLTGGDQIAALHRELSTLASAEPADFSGLRAFFDDDEWLDERDTLPAEFRETLKDVVRAIRVHGVGDYSLELVSALVDAR
jgi:hypothetical protein